MHSSRLFGGPASEFEPRVHHRDRPPDHGLDPTTDALAPAESASSIRVSSLALRNQLIPSGRVDTPAAMFNNARNEAAPALQFDHLMSLGIDRSHPLRPPLALFAVGNGGDSRHDAPPLRQLLPAGHAQISPPFDATVSTVPVSIFRVRAQDLRQARRGDFVGVARPSRGPAPGEHPHGHSRLSGSTDDGKARGRKSGACRRTGNLLPFRQQPAFKATRVERDASKAQIAAYLMELGTKGRKIGRRSSCSTCASNAAGASR